MTTDDPTFIRPEPDSEPTFAGDLTAFRARLAARGVDVDNLRTETSGTIQTRAGEAPVDLGELPILSLAGGDLNLGDRIGDGGMGVVHVARQRALNRDVAVKIVRARDARERDEAMIDLVREARVAGGLEHPNIVPVHALARSETGQVLLVMKRIEGRAWSSMLAERADIDAQLRQHLDVLMDVCRAVHFAHDRGVVHCDLKPQNVMVGGFGEVYLLDWGIAMHSGTVVQGIAGTPSFIAPEMVTLDAVIDARTDVYLLGGLLHVILTGRPPHAFGSVSESLHAAACAVPPRFSERVPEELARICTRALAAQKQNRFQSAEEFRLAIVGYLEHAGARALYQGASEQLATLEDLLATPSTDDETDADRDARAFRAWTAARFGFEQALREWPTFGAARAGLQRAHVAFLRWEIGRRRADRARAILAEVGVVDEGITAALQELEAELAREAEAALRRDELVQAWGIIGRARSHVFTYLAATLPWVVTVFVLGSLRRSGVFAPTAVMMAAMMVALTAAFGGITWWLRVHSRNSLLPKLSMLAMSANAAIVTGWVAVAVTDIAFHLGLFVAHLLFAVVVAAMGIFIRPAMGLGLVPILVSFWVLLRFPEFCLETNGVALALVMALIARMWPSDDVAAAAPTPGRTVEERSR